MNKTESQPGRYRDLIKHTTVPLRENFDQLRNAVEQKMVGEHEAGEYVREGIKRVVAQYRSGLTDRAPIAPGLTLDVSTVSLEKRGAKLVSQQELHDVWYSHRGLILNALERIYR